MKTQILKLSILLIVFILLIQQTNIFSTFLKPSTAYAIGDLTVDWGVPGTQPIFSITNMAPGQTVTHTVKVHNAGSSASDLGVRGIKTNDTGNLAQALDITISQNGNTLYGPQSLQNFFDNAQLPEFFNLSKIPAHQDATYLFTVKFRQTAGNEFQGKVVTFDIKLGPALRIPSQCKNIRFTNEAIFGTQRSDRLEGTPGNDLIIGMGGNDLLDGNGGDDCLVGGVGNDVINGGDGNDVILGGGGNDILNGNNGNDTIYSGMGNTFIDGGNGTDACSGKTKRNCEVTL